MAFKVPCTKEVKKKKKKLSNIEKLRKKKEKEMKSLIKEVAFYILFLLLLLMTAVNSRDPRSFVYKRETLDALNLEKLRKIKVPGDMWTWIEDTMVPFLFPTKGWDNTELENKPNIVSTMAAFRLGPVRIRQHRTGNDSGCALHSKVKKMNVRCEAGWSPFGRDWADYSVGWAPLTAKPKTPDAGQGRKATRSPWEYQAWSVAGGIPVMGTIGTYSPGGYIASLGTQSTLRGTHDNRYARNGADQLIQNLRKEKWVDEKTRVVIIEMTLFSQNAYMFALVTAMFEFQQANVIKPSLFLHPFCPLAYQGKIPAAKIICDILVVLATVWFMATQILELKEHRLAYFKQMWNLLKFVNMVLTMATIVLYMCRFAVTFTMIRSLRIVGKGDYYNFQTLAFWDELFGYLIGFVVFLSNLQMLHLLRFNRRMSILGATLKAATGDLAAFALFFFFVFMAFVAFCFMMFGRVLVSFRSVPSTMRALMTIALGDFDFEALRYVNRVFAPAFFFLYMIFIVFILINMLVTILMDAFSEVRDDLGKLPNDYELIDYVIARLRSSLWNSKPSWWLWTKAQSVGLVSKKAPKSEICVITQIEAEHVQDSNKRVRPRDRYRSRFAMEIEMLGCRLDTIHAKLDSMGRCMVKMPQAVQLKSPIVINTLEPITEHVVQLPLYDSVMEELVMYFATDSISDHTAKKRKGVSWEDDVRQVDDSYSENFGMAYDLREYLDRDENCDQIVPKTVSLDSGTETYFP